MSKPRVLVTGASGFTGRYVCKELIHQGYDVFALTMDGSLDCKSIDIGSYDEVLRCITLIKPESVIHLAGIAFAANKDPNGYYRVHIEGTCNLLRALKEVGCIRGVVALASSAQVYGDLYPDCAITEEFKPQPLNDYSVSKLAMEFMASLHMDSLPIVITRPFNYTGRGQNENFVIPKIVKAYKERQSVLELGSLDVSRDFSDVRDIAKYYVSLVTKGITGCTVNLCSGSTIDLNEVIRICEKLTDHTIDVRSVSAFKRKNELKMLLGSPKLLWDLSGFQNQYSIEDTLNWMLDNHD